MGDRDPRLQQRLSNKLLVLIDGRSVYTPLFAGVYWDVQDTLLEDIERIEVIRGPGGDVWGANAVNGVINIITKRGRDTQGGFAEGGGNEEEISGAPVTAGSRGDKTPLRARYVKTFERDEAELISTGGLRTRRLGVWRAPASALTLGGNCREDLVNVRADLLRRRGRRAAAR